MRRFAFLMFWLSIAIPAFGAKPAFNDKQLCQAAIATNNGRSAKIIKVLSSKKGLVEVTYVRPTDKKRFKYWCKVESNEIRWADEYIRRWSENSRIYYKLLDAGKTLEVRSVIMGDENQPIIRVFKVSDF